MLLKPHSKDLGGGFVVRRLLPSALKQSVGPFIFFDHFGPVSVAPQDNHDVRPHPHIGLATVTYLFEGALMHRDNLGTTQRIEPGAINWMTAGRGIVHSERRPDDLANTHYTNHGLQIWLALPAEHEDAPAAFAHYPASDLPELQLGDARVRVLVGHAFGLRSPVVTASPTLYLDIELPPNSTWDLPRLATEQAVYAVKGSVEANGETVPDFTMAVLNDGATLVAGAQGARLAVLGGEPLGPRFIWWNFVSTSKEKIETVKLSWERNDASVGMGQVAGETERIPLPPR